MSEKQTEIQEVNIQLKEIELPKYDYKQYVGKKEKIAKIETLKGNYGYYMKFITTIVDIVKFGTEEKELCATRIFGLQEDENKQVGWGKDTQLGQFLKAKNVSHPDELLGREVTIQLNIKDGKEFLSFI